MDIIQYFRHNTWNQTLTNYHDHYLEISIVGDNETVNAQYFDIAADVLINLDAYVAIAKERFEFWKLDSFETFKLTNLDFGPFVCGPGLDQVEGGFCMSFEDESGYVMNTIKFLYDDYKKKPHHGMGFLSREMWFV